VAVSVDQREVQRGIREVCDRAARTAGLDRETWIRHGRGNGELAVLPLDEPPEVVVDRYVREIDAELRRYNGIHPGARLRLRMAVHPPVTTALVDSAVLRAALAEAPEADLALLVSVPVFDDTIASLATGLRPGDFRRVRIEEGEHGDDAWLWVPGPGVAGQPAAADPPRTVNTVRSTFHDRVTANGAVFGVRMGDDG
jgi:hypothetical protein